MNFINISNFPYDKIYVLLSKGYRRNLINNSIKILKLKNYYGLSKWINNICKTKFNGGDIKYWIDGKKLDNRTGKIHPKFMPLYLVIKLAELNKENIESLHNNLLSYRSGGSGLIISPAILPIKVTPELDSIVTHLFGDGAAGDFTPSYTQKHREAVDNFIKKLENCFGQFEKSIYLTQGKYQVKFPKAITDILSEYYSIVSYKSHESKMPIQILNRKDKKFKLACIISFIVDEGNIRDVISLYSVNKELLSNIRQMSINCDYNCSEIRYNNKANSYLFTLSTKDIERLYQDIQNLSKEFPTCNLSFKDEAIKFIINRRTKKNPKNSSVTKKAVFNALKKGKFSALEISRATGYAYCTIIHCLEQLLKENKVKRNMIENKTYLWESTEFNK